MPSDRRASLAELPHRVRERLDHIPEQYREWKRELNEDPSLLWRTPLIRIGIWAVLGAVGIWLASWLPGAFSPPVTPGSFEEATNVATLYVACTNPDCLAQGKIRRPMDFSEWPEKCEKCGQEAVYRATLCKKCGQWYAVRPGEANECPHCAANKPPEIVPDDKPAPPTNTDDAEDPWG